MGNMIGTHEGYTRRALTAPGTLTFPSRSSDTTSLLPLYRAVIWLNSEPCGVFCGLMSWAFLAYGMGATTFSVIKPWLGFSVVGCLHMVCFNALSLLAMYCHFRAMTTDPGAVPKAAMPCLDDDAEMDYEATEREAGASSRNKYKKFCKRCKAFKPVRAHHCSICTRCIVKMDHHCPWVNNCVGIGNQKLFLLFVGWTSVVCGYALILIVSRFVLCAVENKACGNEGHLLFVLFLFIESMLFGLFTLCMLGDQLSSLRTNQTQIDKLKNEKHEVRVEVNEVCGTPSELAFHWGWFFPLPVAFTETVREKVLGYRVAYSASVAGAHGVGGSGAGGLGGGGIGGSGGQK